MVSECSEWFGDEKVLPMPIVFEVSAFDWPMSEWTVPGFVATVGAADLVLLAKAR